MSNVLIIGGTSGLGLQMGLRLASYSQVIVTGRENPLVPDIMFKFLELGLEQDIGDITNLVSELPEIDMLVYCAGFYQQGTLTNVTQYEIENMIKVGLTSPVVISQEILMKQKQLKSFIAITSTSQWTPRLNEPVYTATKAALGMFANSLSLDRRVDKVLVAGPAGMKTDFWREYPNRDMEGMLEPDWVAEKILEYNKGDFRYKFIRILRDEPRVEVMEVR